MQEWFESWFDTKYYPILYEHRDDEEAQVFLKNFLQVISLPQGSWILDLACGEGRHSKYLHQQGFAVVGIDLSPRSIHKARQHFQANLFFEIQDMRNFQLPNSFDLIMSLFTSFGYFQNIQENHQVLASVSQHLKPNGYFLLDFFNAFYVQKHLVPQENIQKQGITFRIQREIKNYQVIKTIEVIDGGQTCRFEEKVHLFSFDEIKSMLLAHGLVPLYVWGGYSLEAFNEESSPRCIILSRKNI